MSKTDAHALCSHHTPDHLPYLAAHEDAEMRSARGEVQTQCPACKVWLWPHEQGRAPVIRRECPNCHARTLASTDNLHWTCATCRNDYTTTGGPPMTD